MVTTEYSLRNPVAVLDVSGPDAATFLQGQFTNDLSAPAAASPCVYGLWLNVKGRVLADSYVLRTGEEHFLVVSFDGDAALIRQRLEDFIIADEVDVADLTVRYSGVVVHGDVAADGLSGLGLNAPGWGAFSGAAAAWCFRSRDLGRSAPAWHIVFEKETVDVWRGRFASWQEVDVGALATRRCRAGIPVIPREVGPGDLPNEAGLDAEAISYTKGCYLGQEVMSRLKNLGQVRRRLFVVNAEGPELAVGQLNLPAPLLEAETGKAVGELRSVYRDGAETIGMAMLSVALAGPGAVYVLEGDAAVQFTVTALAEGRAQ